MSLKKEWTDTGKSVGNALGKLGETLARSVKTGVEKIGGTADGKGANGQSNVFNDGSWRRTGRALGGAAADVGVSVLHSVKKGVDTLDEAVEKRRNKDTFEGTAEDISNRK